MEAAMEEIMLWKIKKNKAEGLNAEIVNNVKETETENQLEEVITNSPELLMEDLKLIGRQTNTASGPLDLLGVDSDGRLVIFELKRGTLTRDAVAQIIDYASYISDLEPNELTEHISSRSGNSGIDKIDNFLEWYLEQYGKDFSEHQNPRMVLVGLGADEKTKRMVSFLADSDLDISLTTFHGFQEGDNVFLARQVEVLSKPQKSTTTYGKKMKLEMLKQNVEAFGLKDYYYDISAFFRDKFPTAAQEPSPSPTSAVRGVILL
jgi:hypothetical protein